MRTRSPFAHPMTAQTGRPTLAELKASAVIDHLAKEEFVLSDGSRWYYSPTNALTGDDILVATPDSSQAGRYLRAEGRVDLACAFTFATADNATILTLPTGCHFFLADAYWEVTTLFAGGSSSAIAVDSSKSGYSTAGDILGGSAGDVEATLVAGRMIPGTVGDKMDSLAELRAAKFTAADTFRLQRVTSAFTAGVGKVHLVGQLFANPGA